MDDFDNITTNIKLYKNYSIPALVKYDTYLNANDQEKNYGKSDLLLADNQ
ncbi:MAG: hypothetical protein WCL02_03950 [bacterium]